MRTKTLIKELGVDESFGEIGFFSGQVRCCTAKSKNFADLISLDFYHIQELLQDDADAQLQFTRIEREVNEGNYKQINIQCYICGTLGHTALDCERVTEILGNSRDAKTKTMSDDRILNFDI